MIVTRQESCFSTMGKGDRRWDGAVACGMRQGRKNNLRVMIPGFSTLPLTNLRDDVDSKIRCT